MRVVDRVQYKELYGMYMREMFAYGMAFGVDKETVLDAIHDVFLHIIERENEIKEQANPKFYLLCSLKNRLLSMKRTEILFENIDEVNDYSFSIAVSGLEDVIEEEESRIWLTSQIESMLAELTSRQREVIYLRYMQNLSYDEIGGLLQITTKAVRKLNYRALERMKERYGDIFVIFIILVSRSYCFN